MTVSSRIMYGLLLLLLSIESKACIAYVPRSKCVLCSSCTDRHTLTHEFENRRHPFRVAGSFLCLPFKVFPGVLMYNVQS